CERIVDAWLAFNATLWVAATPSRPMPSISTAISTSSNPAPAMRRQTGGRAALLRGWTIMRGSARRHIGSTACAVAIGRDHAHPPAGMQHHVADVVGGASGGNADPDRQ